MFDVEAYRSEQTGRSAPQMVKFYYKSEEDKDGEFHNVEYVKILVDRLTEHNAKVNDEHRKKYAREYEAFQKGEELPPEGVPIKEWAMMTPADLAAAKSLKILTVEQLANSPDQHLQKSRLVRLKYKAIDYLESRQDEKLLGKLRDELEKKEEMIKILEDKVASLIKAQNVTTDPLQ